MRYGYGVYSYEKNHKYKKYAGEWLNNMRTGTGIMYHKNNEPAKYGQWEVNNFKENDIVQGCQKGDCFDGSGVFVWEDGSRYEGTYKNGRRHGYGVYYFPNSDKYEGFHRMEYLGPESPTLIV